MDDQGEAGQEAARIARDIAAVQAIDDVDAMLREVCAITGMGFAAVARVTPDRWTACQVVDGIEFGLDAGDELDIKTTICDEIRSSGRSVYIDHVAQDSEWRTHHVPALYGFESYLSVPIVLSDGRFFGTLCAIDPDPSRVPLSGVVDRVRAIAASIAAALEAGGTGRRNTFG